MHSFARFCYPSFTVSLYRESRATKVIHCITVPSLFGEFYEIFRMKTHEHVRSSTSWYGADFLGNLSWYSYMLVWQFLLRMPWRRAGNSSDSTASWHRVSACILLSFVYSFTVQRSRATKVIHCITVPSLFGEFYEIFHMKTREHVRSSTSWYGAVFLGNLSWYLYMLVWQFLLRMPWRRAGNSSGSTASWHIEFRLAFWRARCYRDCPCIERNAMKRVSSVPSWYAFVCALLLSFVYSFTVQRKSCN